MQQQLATSLPLGAGWRLDGVGSVRDPAAIGAPLTGDLLLLVPRGRAGIAPYGAAAPDPAGSGFVVRIPASTVTSARGAP